MIPKCGAHPGPRYATLLISLEPEAQNPKFPALSLSQRSLYLSLHRRRSCQRAPTQTDSEIPYLRISFAAQPPDVTAQRSFPKQRLRPSFRNQNTSRRMRALGGAALPPSTMADSTTGPTADYDDGFDAGAVVAAMGFSGFGGRPSKKRRYNPRTDVAVVAAPVSSTPIHNPAGDGAASLPAKPPAPERWTTTATATTTLPRQNSDSGSTGGYGVRRAPLSLPPPKEQHRQRNEAEIDLEEDGDEGQEALPTKQRTPSPPDEDAGYGTDPDPEPQYIDTSREPRREASEAREIQAKIDAIVEGAAVAAAAAMPINSSGGGDGGGRGMDGDGTMRSTDHHGRLPPRPPPQTLTSRGARGRGSGGGGGGGDRGGPRQEHIWWHDYSDKRFNQNPWEWLERARGLPSPGSWIPRDAPRASMSRRDEIASTNE